MLDTVGRLAGRGVSARLYLDRRARRRRHLTGAPVRAMSGAGGGGVGIAHRLAARRRTLLRYERALWAQGVTRIAGVDEVGVGPLAGPLIAAAVILPPEVSLRGIDDSKKLTPCRARPALCGDQGLRGRHRRRHRDRR